MFFDGDDEHMDRHRDPGLRLARIYTQVNSDVVQLGDHGPRDRIAALLREAGYPTALIQSTNDLIDQICGAKLSETTGMNDVWEQQLKPRLEFFERACPADAVVLADAHREEVAPNLIAVIEAIADDPVSAKDGEYMLHRFARQLLARVSGVSVEMSVLNGIVAAACDLDAVEMLETIRQWFAEELLDEAFADLARIEKNIIRPFEWHQDRKLRHRKTYVRDVAQEIAWFASYRDDATDFDETETFPLHEDTSQEPYVRSFEKIGRNDPCSCGSGKKFKKYH